MSDKQLMPWGDWYKSLPQKRMGAGVLFINNHNEILIVKPSYKNGWIIPGGVVDKNESPRMACIREVKEELGLSIEVNQLLCLDYYPTVDESTENIQFVFYSGILKEDQIEKIQLQNKELSEYKFLPVDEALKNLRPKLQKRILKSLDALKNNSVCYLESGEYV